MIGGLYGSGMHDFIIRECEIGTRAAEYEDMEMCGFSALIDVMLLNDMRKSTCLNIE